MSKMPTKKKSCFQITSVTQAQVAASSIPDDTESLDDPDESRSEDVSRANLEVCDWSSSEENNVGEPPEGHTGPVNGVLPYSKSTGTGRAPIHNTAPGSPAVQSPITTSSSTAPVTVANTSCNSRFRVIKLDHGTGEPFRRGRWTCTEFYEKDSDSNSVSRTVDSIKPAVNLDHSTERDSGLGATSISVITSISSTHISESTPDSGYSASITHLVHPSESVHQGYSLPPQIGNGVSAFQPTGCTASQKQQQAQVNMQPVAPQTVLSNSLNGVHHGAMQQKSPIIPQATQPHQFAYISHPSSVSPGHPDHHQQHLGSNSKIPPMTSPAVGPKASQVPSPINPPTTGQGVKKFGGEAVSAQALLSHAGNSPAVAPVLSGGVPQQPVSQSQPSGGLAISSSSSAVTTFTSSSHSGGQNVSATVPNATNSPPDVPNHTTDIGELVQLHGAHRGAASNLCKLTDDSKPKPDALPLYSAGVVPVKDGVMPFFSESLNLPAPAVNSLFGIRITMDVDEDSASGASVVAIDNKIEQAMDLVKSHLMYAVREEVEVLKEQIKELYERNSVLERENAVLKSLANSEQINQLTSQLSRGSRSSPPPLQQQQQPSLLATAQLTYQEGAQSIPHQPNITSS